MIVLFYNYVEIVNPKKFAADHRELCKKLELTGRVIIAFEGINATLGGTDEAITEYIKNLREVDGFSDVDFKTSPGDATCFPKLSVKVRNEIVSLGVNTKEVTAKDMGKLLSPEDFHKMIEENKNNENFVLVDTRNWYESKVGHFEGSEIPNTISFREFPEYVQEKKEEWKDKVVAMYCTGGIRCEILSVVMKNRGFNEVYQIDGGIVRYGNKFGNDGLWEGSLYTFDNRLSIDFAANPALIGECDYCKAPTRQFYNCTTASCHQLALLCEPCGADASSRACPHDPAKQHDHEMSG
jgi:UPF0176 protein